MSRATNATSDKNRKPFTRMVDESRREAWREALTEAKGNISHAARAMRWSRSYGMALTCAYDLSEWARRLRLASGAKATGRPPTPRIRAKKLSTKVDT